MVTARCDPDLDGGTCILDRKDDAIGIALSGLDFGLFIGAKISTAGTRRIRRRLHRPRQLRLVGVPGLSQHATLTLALSAGFALGGFGAVPAGIDFKESFKYDEGGPGPRRHGVETGIEQDGYLLDTGNPDNPMLIDFEAQFLIEVLLAGYLEIALATTRRTLRSFASTASSISASSSARGRATNSGCSLSAR